MVTRWAPVSRPARVTTTDIRTRLAATVRTLVTHITRQVVAVYTTEARASCARCAFDWVTCLA